MRFSISQRFVFFIFCWVPFFSQAQTPDSTQKQGGYYYDFIRKTFYTWTTAEQIEALRENKVLLTKSRSETRGYSAFDIALREEFKNHWAAQMLQEDMFAKKRFAWINGWATVMGCKGEKYGHHLIKMVLSDSAIIGKFNATWQAYEHTFTFYDMKGHALTRQYVLEHKNRIAVIYHLSTYPGKRHEYREGTLVQRSKKAPLVSTQIPFREYVIVNEKMIDEWTYGTSAIKAEMELHVQQLNDWLRSGIDEQWGWMHPHGGWPVMEPQPHNPLDAYMASICFKNDNYLFTANNLKAIVKEMELAIKEQKPEIRK